MGACDFAKKILKQLNWNVTINDKSSIIVEYLGKKFWFRTTDSTITGNPPEDIKKSGGYLIGKEKDSFVFLEISQGTLKVIEEKKERVDTESKLIEKMKGLFKTMKRQLIDLIGSDVKQIILTGAPGTGKTYTAKMIALYYCLKKDNNTYEWSTFEDEYRKYLEVKGKDGRLQNQDIKKKCELEQKRIKSVQFHPSSDFVKGSRPVLLKGKDTSTLLQNHFIKKKFELAQKRIKFVQFHPSYDYSDFVEGLRPVLLKGKDAPTFVRMDGIFKSFCREAAKKKGKKYFFIIDEINRADLSRVFGELMYGLEKSYRGSNNRFDTQYMNLPVYEMNNGFAEPMKDDVFKEGFYIPENVYIIGTMNDIDRSVEAFDFALRRRFIWINVDVKNELNALDQICNTNVDMKREWNVLTEMCGCSGEVKSRLNNLIKKYEDDEDVKSKLDELIKKYEGDEDVKSKLDELIKKYENNGDVKSESDRSDEETKEDLKNGIIAKLRQSKIDELKKRINAMNKKIVGEEGKKVGLSKEYQIGHAYFNSFDGNNYSSIWDTRIEPLLREYCRGNTEADKLINECKDAFVNDVDLTGTAK